MVDYYSVLLRAVTAPDAGDAAWRRTLYDRARQMLGTQLRAKHPTVPIADIAAEQANLEAAIERIESEMSWTDGSAFADGEETEDIESDVSADAWVEPERVPTTTTHRFGGAMWIVLAVVAAALGAGSYIFWAGTTHKAAPPEAATAKSDASGKAAPADRKVTTAKDESELPYVFLRQPTFYRTLQPVGTVIIDKLQHFLYLIQPNNVAIRYGIGVGERCINLAGLHRIASKAEPPGGPGSPLGARELDLDDGKSNIHGTNAPKTIGTSVALGCIRLVNDDIVDLYNRVKVSTPVVAGE
ncbi:MAG TPA: L,D-transpeptidase [Xanthobacteraceae bacterium]|nr:L,D-transpeptidase [Xanthobacteraceae bacterium]